MLTDENLQELEPILRKARLARLREQMQVIEPSTTIDIDLSYNLHITASKVEEVAALVVLESHLRQQVWLVLACQSIYLWLADTPTQIAHYTVEDLESWTKQILEVTDMPAVAEVADAPAISTIVQQATLESLAPKLSNVIDQELVSFLKSAEFKALVEEQVRALVGDRLQSMLDTWLGGSNGAQPESAVTIDVTPESATPEPSPTDTSTETVPPTTAKKNGSSKSKAAALKVPDGYIQLISTRYSTALDKLLPSDQTERIHYLEAIAKETGPGKTWLNRISTALDEKYKSLTKSAAYQGLVTEAKSMLEKLSQTAA